MRLLQFGLILALASGFAAIIIYINGLANICTYGSISDLCLTWDACVCVCVWMNMYLYLLLIWSIDEKSLLSDEDLGALESLQSGFQKCVVSFYLYI